MAKAPVRKRKERKNIAAGIAHVNSTFNNTMITITDVQGNTISWSSAGSKGFKGSRKSTPFAAQMAAEDAGAKAQDHGVQVQGVNQRCARCSPLGSRLPVSATSPPFPTMVAVRASVVGFNSSACDPIPDLGMGRAAIPPMI